LNDRLVTEHIFNSWVIVEIIVRNK